MLHIRVLVQIGVTRVVWIIDDGGHAFDGGQRLLRHIAQNHLSVAAVQRGIRPIAPFRRRKTAVGDRRGRLTRRAGRVDRR